MSAPLVFLDTETTGLSLDDGIWEFAGIRREVDGTEETLHLFLEHDEDKCRKLPEPFRTDHLARFPGHRQAASRGEAVLDIAEFLAADGEGNKPHIVGAVPNFDTERLALLLGSMNRRPSWHYHLIDVEALAVGWVRGRYGTTDEAEARAVELPWDSDDLSRAVGVEPPGEGERHTAMGDARWVMRLYDAITGGTP